MTQSWQNRVRNRREEIISVVALAVPNVIVWVLLFPGYFQADYQSTIVGVAVGEPSQWHSLVWAYLAFPFIYLSPHYAVYGLAQIALFVIATFLSVRKLKQLGLLKSMIPLSLLYALFPAFLLYNELYCGDICFAILLMPLTTLIVELVESKGETLNSRGFCVKAAVLLFFVLSLRKNALLIGLALCIATPLLFRGYWKRGLAAFGSGLLAALLVNALFPVVVGATASPSQEMLAIPSLQVAAVYASDGDIPEEANEFFLQFRSAKEWKDSYSEQTADSAKLGMSLSLDFVKNWLAIGLANPKTYALAYLQLVHPFWTFGSVGGNFSSVDFGLHEEFTTTSADKIGNESYLAEFDGAEGKSGVWLAVQNLQSIIATWHLPFVSDFYDLIAFNTGLPFWVLIIGLFASRKGKRKDFAMVATPVACIIISLLLFAPVPMFRYAMQAYYCLPMLILYLHKRTSRWAGASADDDLASASPKRRASLKHSPSKSAKHAVQAQADLK